MQKPVNWKEKFFKTVPYVDANGDPVPQDQPLNSVDFFEGLRKGTDKGFKKEMERVERKEQETRKR